MASPRRAIVLSDLHMGPDNGLCSFRDDAPLAGFLHRLAEEADASPLELILAGDVFDFLQVTGYGGFGAAKAAGQFEEILASPRTATVIAALRRLAGRPGVEITLLSGNHDPELLVPDVRRRFEEEIGRAGSVLHADDTPLRPTDGERLPVWGRALGEEDQAVWVIHGDRWDPINMIDRSAVLQAVGQGAPVALPAGSHLVFEVLQKLKPSYGWVDQLKPEAAVLALLLYLDPAEAKRFFQTQGVTPRMLRSMVAAALRKGPVFGPETASSPPPDTDLPVLIAGLFAGEILQEPEGSRPLLLAELERRLSGGLLPAPGTLAVHGGLGRLLLRTGLRALRSSDRFQGLDALDAIRDNSRWYVPEEVAVLVAGHTHGARMRPDLRPVYVNSGTWLPVGRIPTGEIEELIDQLEKGPSWPAEAPRTFVHVDLRDGPPQIRLCACNEKGEMRELARA